MSFMNIEDIADMLILKVYKIFRAANLVLSISIEDTDY